MSGPWQTYPRPDFQRSGLVWTSLNGTWDFAFDDDDTGIGHHWHQSELRSKVNVRPIEVPFVFQTPASGINEQGAHEVLWYERTLSDIRTQEHKSQGYCLLLRFGAVDYEATVWVNGLYVGSHQGGHVPFDLDITDAIKDSSQDNRVTVRVRDSPYDLTQPRGKQYWKPQPESIFYTPSSGIWQSVWLESVPATRIADSSHGTILESNDIESGELRAAVAIQGRHAQEALTIKLCGSLGTLEFGATQADAPRDKHVVNLELPMLASEDQLNLHKEDFSSISDDSAWRQIESGYVALWSPENPILYDITITLSKTLTGQVIDEVHTTTGMRSLSWNHADNSFRLNGKPYFQALVLDQGYWPQSNMTPPDSHSFETDIKMAKAMGFNGCRKHQKVEDPLFLYWADQLGYLVWGEMANAYEFSSSYVDRFDAEWQEAVRRDLNHPCIVAWTPVNESWGYKVSKNDYGLRNNGRLRNHLRSLYYTTKSIDPTRPVNDNCGWEHVSTDLTTFHEYADAPQLKEFCATMEGILGDRSGNHLFVAPIASDAGASHSNHAPIICTEFGGVNIAPAKGDKSGDRDWGYTTASDPADLLRRLETLVMAVVDGGLCCGFVYTQLTDIEQEVNGLYSFDRKPKLEVEKVKAIMDKAKARYFELLKQRRARHWD